MDECTVSFKEHKLLLEVGVICLDVFFSFRRNLFSFFKTSHSQVYLFLYEKRISDSLI